MVSRLSLKHLWIKQTKNDNLKDVSNEEVAQVHSRKYFPMTGRSSRSRSFKNESQYV